MQASNVGKLVDRTTRANRVANRIDQIAKATNWISGAALLFMMLLTAADVSLRKLFNSPILGSMEIIEYMMAVVVSLAIGYCAIEKEHVRVDLVISRFSERIQTILNVVASLVFLLLFALVTWQMILKGQESIAASVTSMSLYIPEAPFVFVVALGSAVLCLVMIKDAVYYLQKAIKK